ncbi:MAG: transglycosylase SLT domain-containing protein [Erythrobacter sp.]
MNDIAANPRIRGDEPAGQSAPARRPIRPAQADASTAPVEQAIAGAAQQSSVEFDYLLAQARIESSLNPDARARTSSATGLYQFIESTWLETMQRHGNRFGLSNIAAQINADPSGGVSVSDPAMRSQILALRNDPQIASFMAAGLAEDNRAQLLPILGREPDNSELYLAHFLGAGGASRFLSALQDNPSQSAASLFVQPARANRPIFYESDGSARSLAGVMEHLRGKMDDALGVTPSVSGSIAAASAFDPLASPAITLGAQSAYPPAGPSAGPISGSSFGQANAPPAPAHLSAPAPANRPSMSQVLQTTFGAAESSAIGGSGDQIRKAYEQLRAFGL